MDLEVLVGMPRTAQVRYFMIEETNKSAKLWDERKIKDDDGLVAKIRTWKDTVTLGGSQIQRWGGRGFYELKCGGG